MKNTWKKTCVGTVTAFALLLALPAAGQQSAKESEREAGTLDQYEKLLKPADMHEILGRFVGSWQADMKIIRYGTPPIEDKAKETVDAQWILNDRFVEANYTLSYGGSGSKGKILIGYNGATKQFTRYNLIDWDSRGTFSTGIYIRKQNSIVFRGTELDPVSGDSFERREVFTFGPDKDKIHYQQFYVFADGTEIKPVEGYYVRVKK